MTWRYACTAPWIHVARIKILTNEWSRPLLFFLNMVTHYLALLLFLSHNI
jgi:hypothetical protein